MVITAIERTKRGKYALFIEGEFVFSVTDEQLVKEHLKAGMTITSQDLDQIKEHADTYFARERALNLLSARSYTKKMLYRKLTEKVDGSIAEKTVNRMEELGLLNDEEYARRKAADLYHLKKYGRRRVIDTLVEKGIDRNLAAEIAEELEPEEEEVEDLLYGIVERKYSRVLEEAGNKNDLYKRKARVQNALLRKGYSYEEVGRVVRRYLEENGPDF